MIVYLASGLQVGIDDSGTKELKSPAFHVLGDGIAYWIAEPILIIQKT